MNTQATGATAPKIPAINPSSQPDNIQDLTPLTQAFISLSGAVSLNFDIFGKPESIRITRLISVIDDAHKLINEANKLIDQANAALEKQGGVV